MSSSPRATVRHAVIPCLDNVELLPIGGVPMLEWVVRECAASGTSDLLIVTCEDLDAIRSLIAPRVGSPGFPLQIEFSQGPTSFAEAIAAGRAFADQSPLGVALPTNLFVGDAPGLAQVVETYYRTGKNVAGVVGDFATDEVELAPALDRVVGRFLLANSEIGAGLDEQSLLHALVQAGCVIGRRMRGQFLDVTFPEGREEASRFALRPPRPSTPTGRILEA
jgi:NDP-sugar pyrophosphorylase family protein